jgi:hypothetical protein
MVNIEIAGMGIGRRRMAVLTPEVPDRTLRAILTNYREVKEINAEAWSRAYSYQLTNSVRIAIVILKQHIPSHMTIDNISVLIS